MGVRGTQKFHFGCVELEVLIRLSRGGVEYGVGYTSLRIGRGLA